MTDWSDPQDKTVARCLTVKCDLGMCGAFPGEHCKSFDGSPLPNGRLVHHFRLDKLVKDDNEPT